MEVPKKSPSFLLGNLQGSRGVEAGLSDLRADRLENFRPGRNFFSMIISELYINMVIL